MCQRQSSASVPMPTTRASVIASNATSRWAVLGRVARSAATQSSCSTTAATTTATKRLQPWRMTLGRTGGRAVRRSRATTSAIPTHRGASARRASVALRAGCVTGGWAAPCAPSVGIPSICTRVAASARAQRQQCPLESASREGYVRLHRSHLCLCGSLLFFGSAGIIKGTFIPVRYFQGTFIPLLVCEAGADTSMRVPCDIPGMHASMVAVQLHPSVVGDHLCITRVLLYHVCGYYSGCFYTNVDVSVGWE